MSCLWKPAYVNVVADVSLTVVSPELCEGKEEVFLGVLGFCFEEFTSPAITICVCYLRV